MTAQQPISAVELGVTTTGRSSNISSRHGKATGGTIEDAHSDRTINSHNTPPTSSSSSTSGSLLLSLLIEFGPKLILEVMGGAGAVWGFSEVCGLRTSSTVWFWRPCALIVGFFFLMRLIMQVITAWNVSKKYKQRYQRHTNDLHDGHDLELGIESAASTSSSDSSSHMVVNYPMDTSKMMMTTTTPTTTAMMMTQRRVHDGLLSSPDERTALKSLSFLHDDDIKNMVLSKSTVVVSSQQQQSTGTSSTTTTSGLIC